MRFNPKKIFQKHYKRLTKYILVGISGTIINLSILFVLTEFGHVWYLLSELVATGVAFISNYIANTFWTYHDAMKKLETTS